MSIVQVEASGREALERAEKLLAGFPGGLEKAVRSAMARSASHLRTGSSRAARQRYDIKAANIRDAENAKISYSYGSGVQAVVTFAGRRIPLYRFNGAGPGQPAYHTPAYGHVLKSTSPTRFQEAFTARMPSSGHIGIFERTGGKTDRGKDEIRELISPSVPQMLGSPEVEERLAKEAAETFEGRLAQEVNAFLNGWRM